MSNAQASLEGSFTEFTMLQAAMSEATLVIHTPPDFPVNAEILGVCGVSKEYSNPTKYGWIVADFLRWKMLFNRVGEKSAQTWLSSLDLPKFLDSVGGVEMNKHTIEKIVDANRDHITAIPSDNDGFVQAFLSQVSRSARNAVLRNTTLVILTFVPMTAEQDICVDFGGKKIYLTIERIRETINRAVDGVHLPAIFVTPSPLTGGWLCRPSFMRGHPSTPPDKMLRLIAKSCGGAFAARFVRLFTRRGSPLMTDAQRAQVRYDDPMPVGPTKLQTDSLHLFQRQIHESLEQRLSPFARDHAFILKPTDARDRFSFSDSWTEYAPRQSRYLHFWANHWTTDWPPIEGADRFEFLGEAFGGNKASQLFHLQYLAAIELDTHPGDWSRPFSSTTRALFTNISQMRNPTEDDIKRVFDIIEFRSSSMVLAQMVAKAFDLPVPDGAKCRYWHDRQDVNYYSKLQLAFSEARDLFDQAAVLPSENRHEFKDLMFWRAARWLSAAVALRFEKGTPQDIRSFLARDIASLFSKIWDTQKTMLLENQAVRCTGLKWISALGLGEAVSAATPAANDASPSVNPDAQAVSRSVQKVDLLSNGVHGPRIVDEPTGWTPDGPAGRVAEAEDGGCPPHHSAAKTRETENSDAWGGVKDPDQLPEDWGTGPAVKHNKYDWSTGLVVAEPHGAKLPAHCAGKQDWFATGSPRPMKTARLNVRDDGNDGKEDGRKMSETTLAEEEPYVVNTAPCPEPIHRGMSPIGLYQRHLLKKAAAKTAILGEKTEKQTQEEFQESSDELSRPVEKITIKEETLSPKAIPAAQPPLNDTAGQLAEAILVGIAGGSHNIDKAVLADILRKTADILMQETAKVTGPSLDSTQANLNASTLAASVYPAKSNVKLMKTNDSSRPPAEKADPPVWMTAASWRVPQPGEASNSTSILPKETNTARTDKPRAISAEPTAARVHVNPQGVKMTTRDPKGPTPPRTPCAGNLEGMQASQELQPAGNGWGAVTAQETTVVNEQPAVNGWAGNVATEPAKVQQQSAWNLTAGGGQETAARQAKAKGPAASIRSNNSLGGSDVLAGIGGAMGNGDLAGGGGNPRQWGLAEADFFARAGIKW
ncbi:hypothetical protein VTI74DRAFT_7860 [Chaetomium olivicolor]